MSSWAKGLPMEEVSCLLCDSSQHVKALWVRDGGFESGIGIRIVKCQKCGLVFQTPRILPEEIANHYERGYYIFDQERDSFDLQNVRIFFQVLQETDKPPGRLLDVGCAKGWFLALAQRVGWETYGLGISALAASFAREKMGLDVIQGTLASHPFPEKWFDVITIWDVIEHTKNPIADLMQANNLLKDNGLLIIETPNYRSIYSRVLRSYWTGYMIYHTYYFSHDTLGRTLEKGGFHLVKVITPKVNFFSKDGFERWQLRELSGKIISRLFGKRGKEVLLRKLGPLGKPSYKAVSSPPGSLPDETNLSNSNLRKTWVDYINYPTDSFFQRLKLGDALRAYASK